MLRIEERLIGSAVTLDLKGRIHIGGGDILLTDKINSLVQQGYRVIVLNLAGVSSIDSTGLGALIVARTRMARVGGQVRLVNLTKRIKDLVVISGLLSYFDVFESEEAAVSSPVESVVDGAVDGSSTAGAHH